MPDAPLPENQGAQSVESAQQAHSVLDRVLDDKGGHLFTGRIRSFESGKYLLADGRSVQVSASCLVQPKPKDWVLVWSNNHGQAWILNLLSRDSADEPLVISSDKAIQINARKIGLNAQTVHVKADNLVTHAVNNHSVEQTRTEQIKLRVTQVGTEIRRADRVLEKVNGSLIQKFGTWVVNAAQEVRHKARTVLFD